MAANYFSNYFGIELIEEDDDWFDPILGADTRLFVDPFLIFKDDGELWARAHAELIAYFNIVFHMVGNTIQTPSAPERTKALELLRFPEPRPFCLGFTDSGTSGSGSGRGNARRICEAMELSINRGIENLAHFETLGVLNEGIGRDRISDLVCNVLIERFTRYTITVVSRHGIATEPHRIDRGAFNATYLRWDPVEVRLPTNPENGLPVILTPRRFLRKLPSLDAYDFWASSEAVQLRADLNYDISSNVRKKDIVDLARRDPEAVQNWTRAREGISPDPYDLEQDPMGIYNWLRHAQAYAAESPLSLAPVTDEPAFVSFIDSLIKDFKHFVEQRRGWYGLINDDSTPKDEEAAQLLFRALAESRCIAHNIVLDREVDLGRGPVDFKFSSGYENRALLEIKKLHNGKFWNGLEHQLTSYLESDRCSVGRFVAIQYRSHRRNSDVGQRRTTLPLRTRELGNKLGLDLKSTLVDARKPPSASNL